MKKLFTILSLVAGFSSTASAADVAFLNLLTASEFRTLSEDLGSALSYKAVAPAAPLGGLIGFGFDIGIGASSTDISKSTAMLDKATGTSTGLKTMIVPKLHATLGLPFGIDIGAFTSTVPTTNIKLTGAELKIALIKGGVATPAVALRGAMTKMSGVDQLAFDTKSVDLSISKGFAIFTPYAGVGQVWVNSKATVAGSGGAVLDESFTQSKYFLGGNLNFGLANLALETDKTGSASSYSLKFGFRW